MGTPIPGTDTWAANVTRVDPLDPGAAASLVGIEHLANRTRWLATRIATRYITVAEYFTESLDSSSTWAQVGAASTSSWTSFGISVALPAATAGDIVVGSFHGHAAYDGSTYGEARLRLDNGVPAQVALGPHARYSEGTAGVTASDSAAREGPCVLTLRFTVVATATHTLEAYGRRDAAGGGKIALFGGYTLRATLLRPIPAAP